MTSIKLERTTIETLAYINPTTKVKINLEDPVPFLSMYDVSATGYKPNYQTRVYKEVQSGYTCFQEGDVLVAKITPCFENGKGAYIDSLPAIAGFGSTEFHILRAKPGTKPLFLYYVSTSPIFRFLGRSEMSGSAGQKRVTPDFVRTFSLPVFTTEQQDIIISVLLTWDRAIEQTDRLIAAKRRRKQGLMQQLLTGKMRFKEFGKPVVKHGDLPKEWKRIQISDIFKVVTDKVGSSNIPPYSITAGTGFVSHEEKWGKNIAGSQHSNYTLLRKGQFSYNKGNSKRYSCGCVYRLEHVEEIAVPSVFISFESRGEVCDEFYKQYFMADLCAPELRMYITSGARSDGLLNISKDDFFSVTLPLPPLSEQRRIAAILNTCDTEIEQLSVQLVAFKEQKKGMMQQLLTGKVRVKV